MHQVIFVEGLTGSGKSTTAHYLARQLRYSGFAARWLHEGELDHPLSPQFEGNIPAFMETTRQQWAQFFSAEFPPGQIYVIEASYFNNTLETLYSENYPDEKTIAFGLELAAIAAPRNPMMIYLAQPNVQAALDANFENRGEGFKQFVLEYTAKTPYCQHRGLQGEAANTAFWEGFVALTDNLFDALSMDKLAVDMIVDHWEHGYRKMNAALSLPCVPDPTITEAESSRYTGTYRVQDGSRIFKIYYQNGSLFIKLLSQQESQLIPLADNRFEVAGWHFQIFFEAGASEHFHRLHIGGADVDYLRLVGLEAQRVRQQDKEGY